MRIASYQTSLKRSRQIERSRTSQFHQLEDLWRMEIVVEPIFQHVTWKIRDFFELPQEDDFYVDSPEFLFGGDSYCLRLFPSVKYAGEDETRFHVRRLTVTFPERKVSCKIDCVCRGADGEERYDYLKVSLEENFFLSISRIGEERDECVPDGIFTVVCCMRLSGESIAGSSAQGKEEIFPGHNVPFSSRWNPPQMELSTESPCTHVELTVPKFFDLPREVVDSLTSPEFRFAGDTYCFRFRPNGDTDDTDLQLVRLTSTFPERTVCYRVGYGNIDYHAYPSNSRSLVGKIGFCHSLSILEEERKKYAPGGTLSLVLFLRLGERSSGGAGTSDAGQKWSGLPCIQKLQSDYRRLLQKGTESDACFVVRGKEFPVHRAVLRARSTVFEAMFGHDTAEKESGRVVIDDLDPGSFGDFLDYLYTGDVQEKLSDDNAVGLYVAADKYDVTTLKSECVEHLRRTLSVDSFCDVMFLALRHREEDLLQEAISYFKDNLQHIIITAKWQQFVLDNGSAANELFIKALVPGKQ